MSLSQSLYYCFDCSSHFTSNSSSISCSHCDSCAIEQYQSQLQIQTLSSFQPFEIQNICDSSNQPEGILDSAVIEQEDRQPMTITIVQRRIYRVSIDNIESRLSSLRAQIGFFQTLEQLFSEQENGATEEEIQNLEKIQFVQECSICQKSKQEENQINQDQSQKGFKLPCDHIFHAQCVRPWFEKARTCPLCRRSVTSEQ